jgi:hypothetical protein
VNSKLRFALPCLLVLGVALAAVPAHADNLYVYVGNDYTTADGTIYTTQMSMDAGFGFTNPLGDNLSDVDVTSDVNEWVLSDGFTEWDSTMATLENFDVSTDATGAIDGWDFSIEAINFPFVFDLDSSSASGDSVDALFLGEVSDYYGSNSNPGVWAGPFLVATTPEPASGVDLALGGLALGLLAFGKRYFGNRRLPATA